MAITVGNTSNSGDPGTVTSYSWNHTCATNTTLLVVTVGVYDSGAADVPVSSITYNGVALTKAREYQSSANYTLGSIWYLLAPTTGSSLSITVTHGGKCTDTVGSAIDLLGTVTSSPVDSYKEYSLVNANPTATVTVNPAADGSMAVAVGTTVEASAANVTLTTGTAIAEVDAGFVITSAYALASGGVATVAWTDGAGMGALAVTFKAAPTSSAALTGTVTASITEADIVTGGKTIILTLTGDTFIAAGTGSIGTTANTQALIDGITSAGAEATGWNAVVRAGIETTDVVRTSNTVATITLDAEATYNITANETITVTVPAAVLTGASPLVASPTFTITPVITYTPRNLALLGVG